MTWTLAWCHKDQALFRFVVQYRYINLQGYCCILPQTRWLKQHIFILTILKEVWNQGITLPLKVLWKHPVHTSLLASDDRWRPLAFLGLCLPSNLCLHCCVTFMSVTLHPKSLLRTPVMGFSIHPKSRTISFREL